jgi:hypothetical protein
MKRLVKKAEYVHCHACGWDNGDFLRNADGTLKMWAEDLGPKKFQKLDDIQIYKSWEEFKSKNPEGVCPICHKQELDVD